MTNIFTLLTFLIVLDLTNYVLTQNQPPFVKIEQGELKGLELTSRSGQPYHVFYNIPYVNKPERFQPPSFDPPNTWEGVRDATTPGQRCIQHDQVMNKTMGFEDCLTLSIMTPLDRSKDSNYDVLVYIHGGGYRWGTGHIHGGKYFMDEKIVLVNLNYRLGPLGFISTGDGVIQGNMGLKDQVAALKWIKKNVKEFGGNPDSVTIFGESSGAGSVSLHLVSAMSKGLYKNAISQSGTSLSSWATIKTSEAKKVAHELGKELNCPTDNSNKLLECLKSKSASEILRPMLTKWYIDPTIVFRPVIEQLLPGQSESDVFLARYPYDILISGDFEPVPWITGVCEDEGIYLHSAPILRDPKLVKDLNRDWNRVAPITLLYDDNENVTELNIISKKIRDFYFQDELIGENTRQALTDMYSDRYFVHGVRVNALLQAKFKAPVYVYIFHFEGTFSFLQQRGFDKGFGVTHKDDLQYFFDGIGPEVKPGAEQKMSEQLIKVWVDFAKTGIPSPIWGSVKEWKPISKKEINGKGPLNWLQIDVDTKIVYSFEKRMTFWDQLMENHETVMFPRTLESKRVNVKQEL